MSHNLGGLLDAPARSQIGHTQRPNRTVNVAVPRLQLQRLREAEVELARILRASRLPDGYVVFDRTESNGQEQHTSMSELFDALIELLRFRGFQGKWALWMGLLGMFVGGFTGWKLGPQHPGDYLGGFFGLLYGIGVGFAAGFVLGVCVELLKRFASRSREQRSSVTRNSNSENTDFTFLDEEDSN